jgi:hypothetical protein
VAAIVTTLTEMPVLPTGDAAVGSGPWYTVTRGTDPGVYNDWYVYFNARRVWLIVFLY